MAQLGWIPLLHTHFKRGTLPQGPVKCVHSARVHQMWEKETHSGSRLPVIESFSQATWSNLNWISRNVSFVRSAKVEYFIFPENPAITGQKGKQEDAKQMTQLQGLLLVVLHHIMISYSLFPLVLLPLLFYKFSTSCWDDLQDGLIFFMSIWDLMFKMWPEYKDFVYSNFRTNLKNLWRATHVCRWIVKHTVMIEDSWRCCGQRLIRRILFHGTCRKRKRSWNEISMMASTYSLSLWISMLRERSTRLSRSRCFGIVFTKRSTADPSVRPALPKRKSVQVPQPTIDYSEYALSMHTMSYLTLIEIDWSSIHSHFQALAKPVSR